MEKILRIEELSEGKEWSTMEGYAIVTNKQTIKLLIDNQQSCCEQWGYFWCNDNPQDFIGATIKDIKLTDTALNNAKMKENNLYPSHAWFEGDVMFVDIITNKGVLQFVAYNEHNGYYGHTAKVVSTQLTNKEIL